MVARPLFTASDLLTVRRAAVLAEKLTGDFFELAGDEWRRNPYRLFTQKETEDALYQENVFAHVVRCTPLHATGQGSDKGTSFGIVLQDPDILRALLRSYVHDLWTLVLFILTHELIHIVRFRRSEADFEASSEARDEEERLVHHMTRDILSGVRNTDCVLKLYHAGTAPTEPETNSN